VQMETTDYGLITVPVPVPDRRVVSGVSGALRVSVTYTLTWAAAAQTATGRSLPSWWWRSTPCRQLTPTSAARMAINARGTPRI
jgi:hypothetical protein